MREVPIQGKNVGDAVLPHQLEAGAVDQRELAPAGREEGGGSGRVESFVHPEHVHERDEDVAQRPGRVEPEVTLGQSKGLHQDVVGGKEDAVAGDLLVPRSDDLRVAGLIGIEERDQVS